VGRAIYTHTRPINGSSATSTGPTLRMRNGGVDIDDDDDDDDDDDSQT